MTGVDKGSWVMLSDDHCAQFSAEPFPHAVIDGLLTEGAFADMLRLWPSTEDFVDQDGANRLALCRFTGDRWSGGDEAAAFWRRFWGTVYDDLTALASTMFAPYLQAIFEAADPAVGVGFRRGAFEQTDEFTPHEPHNHAAWGPARAFNGLFMVDDAGSSERGTNLHAVNPDDPLRVFEGVYGLDEVVGTTFIPFAPNRLLLWLDGPFSVHSGPRVRPDHPSGPRRHIRLHWAAANPAALVVWGDPAEWGSDGWKRSYVEHHRRAFTTAYPHFIALFTRHRSGEA